MYTHTQIFDTIETETLQREIEQQELDGANVRQITGKWFLIGHGREATLAFSGAVVYEREDN
jgi:hypothetical protein